MKNSISDNEEAKVQSTAPRTEMALRVLGPFAKQGGFYFRVVWPTCSRVLHAKSFKTANRWSSIIQRTIAEGSRI